MMDLRALVLAQTEKPHVKCMVCDTTHDPDLLTYHTIAGDIFVGYAGGLVGSNFNPDGTLKRVSIICRARDCVLAAFDMRGW